MNNNLKQYHLVNNVIGWLICAIACTVYIMTAEATASWWDCGEYIATAFKLQVGHPPGAPTFQLLGRIFSMFSDPASAAHAINIMSAICSGFTILFLYWGITLLAKHMLPDPKSPNVKDARTWAVFAAGIVGALAYTFSDTFWYSAVEGEVYAMSSLFTSLVFWVILKWEEQSDNGLELRWLVLISLLVGVAIGVHLLNLLAVPAIVYVVYFKKWNKVTFKGFLLSGVIAVVVLALILWGIIPGIVNLISAFEVFFVNSIGLPFNSGAIVFFLSLGALIVFGLWFTSARKKNKPVINAAILSLLMLIIGYSTFFVLVIRANTNTPLNENAPKDAVAMRAYLGREQYGQTPLLSGQYYTAGSPIGVENGYAKYVKGTDEDGKDRYIVADYALEYQYREKHTGFLPRMYSPDTERQHPRFYEYWAGPVRGDRPPSQSQNFKYMKGYQFGFMYWRYFMWNFAGRQNDIQGHYFNDDGSRDYLHGNWISGIKFLDEARLGPQDNIPDDLKNNKARNTYYLLPLILGLFGMVYHFVKHPKGAFIVLIMFVMTGLAIAFYLNMPPRQPRERDYAFVGSFCFFAIWIGMGVMALSDSIAKLFQNEKLYKVVMPICFILCMGVPVLMAAENWDDHDRSEKYAARDFAQNYLKSIKKNGIIVTFGDNDTFPLWYAQEVEGTRTDVRVLNYTLSGMYWYVEQLYNKLYDSDPLPFTLTKDFYGLGKDSYGVMDRSNEYLEVTEVLALMRDHPERFTHSTPQGDVMVVPTKRFKITLDIPALLDAGVITMEQAAQIDPVIKWEINKNVLYRHELMILDILGTNKFIRDINIMNPGYIRRVFPLIDKYCIQDAMNYKILPYMPFVFNQEIGGFDQVRFTDYSADYYLNGVDGEQLKWGNLDADIYVDPISLNMGTVQRQNFVVLADDLWDKGETDKAVALINMADSLFPKSNFPRDQYCIHMIETYVKIMGKEVGLEMWNDIYDYYSQYWVYLNSFGRDKASGVQSLKFKTAQILYTLADIAQKSFGDTERADQIMETLKSYGFQI